MYFLAKVKQKGGNEFAVHYFQMLISKTNQKKYPKRFWYTV